MAYSARPGPTFARALLFCSLTILKKISLFINAKLKMSRVTCVTCHVTSGTKSSSTVSVEGLLVPIPAHFFAARGSVYVSHPLPLGCQPVPPFRQLRPLTDGHLRLVRLLLKVAKRHDERPTLPPRRPRLKVNDHYVKLAYNGPFAVLPELNEPRRRHFAEAGSAYACWHCLPVCRALL